MRERTSQLESLFQEASVGREKVEGRVSEDGLTEKKKGRGVEENEGRGQKKEEGKREGCVCRRWFLFWCSVAKDGRAAVGRCCVIELSREKKRKRR